MATPRNIVPISSKANDREKKVKGMQLGATQSKTDFSQLELELGDESKNPWGSDDLIDINADQDDWGKRVDHHNLDRRTLLTWEGKAHLKQPPARQSRNPCQARGYL